MAKLLLPRYHAYSEALKKSNEPSNPLYSVLFGPKAEPRIALFPDEIKRHSEVFKIPEESVEKDALYKSLGSLLIQAIPIQRIGQLPLAVPIHNNRQITFNQVVNAVSDMVMIEHSKDLSSSLKPLLSEIKLPEHEYTRFIINLALDNLTRMGANALNQESKDDAFMVANMNKFLEFNNPEKRKSLLSFLEKDPHAAAVAKAFLIFHYKHYVTPTLDFLNSVTPGQTKPPGEPK